MDADSMFFAVSFGTVFMAAVFLAVLLWRLVV